MGNSPGRRTPEAGRQSPPRSHDSAADPDAMMMAPFDPAIPMMATPAIMTATIPTIMMATIVITAVVIAPIITAVIAVIITAIIAVITIVAIIMTIAIIVLGDSAAARAKRSNRKARCGENSADFHGILSLPEDRAMTGDTIANAYRS